MDTPRSHTAVFPLVADATSFAERIRMPGWWVANVKQKGRTVTWDDDYPADADITHAEGEADMLLTVGYYGSNTRRKATLNGRKAPMSY